MKIREYIAKIGENKNIEDMEKLGDMLADIIYDTKESHPEIYEKYKMCLYEMAYGKVLTEDMAENIVHKMKPDGEHWNIETTTSVKQQYGLNNISDVDFYVVMNMAYNDYKDVFGDDTEMYVKYSKAFILDEDAKEGKVFTYFMEIPK